MSSSYGYWSGWLDETWTSCAFLGLIQQGPRAQTDVNSLLKMGQGQPPRSLLAATRVSPQRFRFYLHVPLQFLQKRDVFIQSRKRFAEAHC